MRKKVPDTGSHGVEALISLSGRRFHIGLSDKGRPARERGRVWEIFSLEPVGEQERKCTECLFLFLFSHLRILSSPQALRSAEHPRSPALPSLVCENKNSLRSVSFPLPWVSFRLAPKPPEARFFIRHCQKWTYSSDPLQSAFKIDINALSKWPPRGLLPPLTHSSDIFTSTDNIRCATKPMT